MYFLVCAFCIGDYREKNPFQWGLLFYQAKSQPSPREAIFTRPCSLASLLVQSASERSIWHGLKKFKTWAYLKQYILFFNQRFTFWGVKEIESTPVSNKLSEFLYLSYWSELILVSRKTATRMYHLKENGFGWNWPSDHPQMMFFKSSIYQTSSLWGFYLCLFYFFDSAG